MKQTNCYVMFVIHITVWNTDLSTSLAVWNTDLSALLTVN